MGQWYTYISGSISGGEIFENVHGLAAAWPWTFANVYRGCICHVRLSDLAGAQPSYKHQCLMEVANIANCTFLIRKLGLPPTGRI